MAPASALDGVTRASVTGGFEGGTCGSATLLEEAFVPSSTSPCSGDWGWTFARVYEFQKTGNFGVRRSLNVPGDGVTGGAASSFGPPSCSLLGSSESFRPRPLPIFLTRLNNEDITSARIFSGNNGCIRDSNDEGVKSTPALLGGYRGVEEAEDCSWFG